MDTVLKNHARHSRLAGRLNSSQSAAVLFISVGFCLYLSASAKTTTASPLANVTHNNPYTESQAHEADLSYNNVANSRDSLNHTSRYSALRVPKSGEKKQEYLSENCFAKRDAIMRKRWSAGRAHSIEDSRHREQSHHQRLRPRLDPASLANLNVSLDPEGNFDSSVEHIPKCTEDGKYEPIQCLMSYCWCVNKYGQAFKNSARTNGDPICDRKLYESESDDLLVVTGIGATRMKNLLKQNDAKNATDRNGLINNPGFEAQDGHLSGGDSDESDFNRRVGSSPEPSLALVPNECTMSRENAKARKVKHYDLDGIWIPECDPTTEKLYAERQCHKSRVCWCVDQVTGLPLRSNEQLTKGPGINCTEVRRIIETASSKTKQESHKTKTSFFHGFSELCDAERRSEFVNNLIGQFRQQLSDYLKQTPSVSSPRGISSSNPYSLSEEQVANWEFSLLDLDNDGKLDDREWSKFKVNFKLVDRLDYQPPRLILAQQDASHTMSPLFILRSQRKCWRDFLEFCGDGDVLDYSFINRTKWLSCTEVPASSAIMSPTNDRSRYGPAIQNPSSIPDAYTRAAAEARRKSKNPFLGILKPD